MPFDTGVYYLITNCLYPNNAALRNDNDNEPVCGILPVLGAAEARDEEKVSSTTAVTIAVAMQLNRVASSGSLPIVAIIDTP